MIKDDIKVIKSAILGEEFNLPKTQLINNTIKINSNRNLNIDSHENISQYKFNCYNNIFDTFNIYFTSIFNMVDVKQNIFNRIKDTSSKKTKFQNDVNTSIEKIDSFYKKNSFKEELFESHIMNKQSVNFGKVSNFFYNKVIKDDQSNSYKENKVIGNNQENYFEIFKKDLITTDNFKKYLLLDTESIYDSDNDISNLSEVNVNSYICQNLINVTRSLFTLHSGSIKNVSTDCFVKLTDENENLICVTSETDGLNFFKYNNSSNMYFDYNSFYDIEYLNWVDSKENYSNLNEAETSYVSDIDSRISSASQNSYDVISNAFQSTAQNLNNLTLIGVSQKKLNVTSDTFSILDRSLSRNAKKYFKIYNEFYKYGSKINQDGTLSSNILNSYVEYKPVIEEITKAFQNIYSIDSNLINAVNSNGSFLNKWMFVQGKIKGNDSFSSDVDLKTNNIYNSINFDSITSKYLEQYRTNLEIAYANDVSIGLEIEDTRNEDFEEERQYILQTLEEEFVSEESYDENREQLFYSVLDRRFSNTENNPTSVSLDFLSYNLNNNQSMIYYRGRPIYEVYTPDFDINSYNILTDIINNQENDYNIFDKNLINTRMQKGSNYFSFKTDCIVKKTKINSLKNSGLDLEIFSEITSSINDKITNNKIVSYSNDIDSNLVLSNKDSKVFNLLFTKDEESDNKFYSNFSITHNEKGKSKFSNYLEILKNNIIPSEDIEENISLLTKLLKNYYKGKYFKSSSILLKNIIKDVIKESKSYDSIENYDDVALCQYFYLHYLKKKSLNKSNSSEFYDVISRRFLKKVIEQEVQDK